MINFYENDFLKIDLFNNLNFIQNAYINDEKKYIIQENKINYNPHILKNPKNYKKPICLEKFNTIDEKIHNFQNEKVYVCFHQYESNFHHFMFDSFYQIFGYLELKKQIPDLKLFTSHIQGSINIFRNYIFKLFGIKDIIYFKRLEKKNTQNYQFNELYIPEPKNPYYFFNILNKKLYDILLEKPLSLTVYDKLFIIRYESSFENKLVDGKRILLNTINISNYLKKFGYKTVKLQNYNLLEKYKLVNNAKKIIVELGASCDNLVFCNRNCNVKILTTNRMTRSWIKFHQNLLKNLSLKGDVLNIGIGNFKEYHLEENWYLEKDKYQLLV